MLETIILHNEAVFRLNLIFKYFNNIDHALSNDNENDICDLK